MGDLPHVQERPEFQRANPGFAYEYQFIGMPVTYVTVLHPAMSPMALPTLGW